MQCDLPASSPFSCNPGCHVWRWKHPITLQFEESCPEIYALDLHEWEILLCEDTSPNPTSYSRTGKEEKSKGIPF